jgi:hypothetical protein
MSLVYRQVPRTLVHFCSSTRNPQESIKRSIAKQGCGQGKNTLAASSRMQFGSVWAVQGLTHALAKGKKFLPAKFANVGVGQ